MGGISRPAGVPGRLVHRASAPVHFVRPAHGPHVREAPSGMEGGRGLVRLNFIRHPKSLRDIWRAFHLSNRGTDLS